MHTRTDAIPPIRLLCEFIVMISPRCQNGVSNTGGVPFYMGNTDGGGSFTATGTMTGGEIGSWTEDWYVNGSLVGGQLVFDVIDQPTGLTVVSTSVVSPPTLAIRIPGPSACRSVRQQTP